MNEKTIANNTTTEKDINKTVVNNAIENNDNNIPVENTNNISDNHISSNGNTKNRVYNIQNLKPYNKTDRILSEEEAKKRGRNGGIKSGEARRQKKTMRETLENALKIELSTEKLEELGADISLMSGDNSVLSAIIASTIREAINGDTKAIQFVRDSIGEKPVDELHAVNETITKEDTDMMKDLRDSLISKVM